MVISGSFFVFPSMVTDFHFARSFLKMNMSNQGRFWPCRACASVAPVVGKARADKPQRMREIARLVETGRHQAKVAEELKITVSAVSRAMRDMRMALAFARKDDSWTDATKHSAVEVTRAWLADHNESLPEAPSSDEEG
jgi:hypothetical protein